MELIQKHCMECGGKLTVKELTGEGSVPYCPECKQYRFPMYNVAVSMIVISKEDGRILLIQQYGRKDNILVAGYVNRGEPLENAVKREIMEELGLTVSELKFNRTRFYEPSNTLMCNFTVWTDRADAIQPNNEIDDYHWYTPEEAKANIKPDSLASRFLCEYLNEN
jgi:NAD+ diphosphatase